MKRLILITVLIGALALQASSARASDNTFLGTGVGAALGGLLGSQFGKGSGQLAATGAGVFLGGMMGNSVGHSMDRADAAYYSTRGTSPMFNAYPSYPAYEPTYVAPPSQTVYLQPEVVEYYAPRNRAVLVDSGYVGPHPPKRSRHCREFTQTVRIDGQVHESYGTACLRPDGSWQIEQ